MASTLRRVCSCLLYTSSFQINSLLGFVRIGSFIAPAWAWDLLAHEHFRVPTMPAIPRMNGFFALSRRNTQLLIAYHNPRVMTPIRVKIPYRLFSSFSLLPRRSRVMLWRNSPFQVLILCVSISNRAMIYFKANDALKTFVGDIVPSLVTMLIIRALLLNYKSYLNCSRDS